MYSKIEGIQVGVDDRADDSKSSALFCCDGEENATR